MSDYTSNPIQLPLFDPVEIKLTKGYTAIVDPVDADLAQHKWYFNNKYAHGWVAGKNNYLHRIILGRMLNCDLQRHEQVDHISGDHLDNRRCNLRLATRADNARNRKISPHTASGYKGVHWVEKAKNHWMAVVSVNRKRIYLGLFATPEEAHAAYMEAARKYFGEFARSK